MVSGILLMKYSLLSECINSSNPTAQKMKLCIKEFFRKCDQTRRTLWMYSYLLKKSLMKILVFCAVSTSCMVLSLFQWSTGGHQFCERHYLSFKTLIAAVYYLTWTVVDSKKSAEYYAYLKKKVAALLFWRCLFILEN